MRDADADILVGCSPEMIRASSPLQGEDRLN
jgi:hypothetical protein